LRQLVLGLLLGGFLALLPDWLRGHAMLPDIPYLSFYLITMALLLFVFYRPILRPIEKRFPKFMKRLTSFFAPLEVEKKARRGKNNLD